MQDDNMCLKYGWQHGDIGNIVNKNTSTQIIYVTYTVDGRNPLPKKGSSSKYIQTWGAVQLQPISDAKKTSNKDANNFTCLVDIQAKQILTTCSFPGLLERSCACISCFIGCCFFYISTPTKQPKRYKKNTLVFPSSPFTPSVFPTSVGLLPSTLYNCGLGSPGDDRWVTGWTFMVITFQKVDRPLGLGNFWPAIFGFLISYRGVC